uniref:Reverse transcriptase n=1 Tax=Cannabis sativa TaxID=3483 RepID=A0A803NLH2_CANSA
MASSSGTNNMAVPILAEEEEDDALAYGVDQTVEFAIDDRWCLVGRFLTERNIDFDAMRHLMASLWQPGKGMYVKELDSNRFLFQFYHDVDIERVIEKSPWTFNNFLLVFQRLKKGEDPKLIPLSHVDMWIQLHDIQSRFKTAQVCKDLGNFIGSFVEADKKNFLGLWRDYLRIRVTLDVSKPLKRRKKILTVDGKEFWVNFKYEHVPTFCFICGIMGHSEGFCPRLFDTPKDSIVKPYGLWMKAITRRKNVTMGSKWLRSFQDFSDEKLGGDASAGATTVDGNDNHVPMIMEGIVGQSATAHNRGENMGFNGNETIGGLDIDSQSDELAHDVLVITDTKRKRIEIELNGLGSPRDGQLGLNNNSFTTQEFGPSGEVVGVVDEVFTKDTSNDNGVNGPKNLNKDIVIQKRPSFVFLCETISKKDKLERVRLLLGFDGVITVEPQGKSGGLAFLWKNEDEARLLGFSQSHIDMEITMEGKEKWRFSGLYGEPNRGQRRRTWDQMRSLALDSVLPWCIMGDTNKVLSHEDKRGGNNYPNWLLRGFQQAVNDCELQDLELIGHPFTWEKGRGTDQWIEVRLDRALCTKNWLDLFPLAKLYNLEFSTSDHCPIFLDLVDNNSLFMKNKVRYENCWLREPLCHQVIKECWNFSYEFDIQQKIKYCGEFLLVWGEAYSGDFKKRLKECKAEINLWKHGRDTISTNNFWAAKSKFKEILTQREVFWRQRSKLLWLQAGDNNSKFFHASASARRRSNLITKLQDSNGIWTSWEDGLDRIMVEYFNDLFTTSGTASIDVISCIQPSITALQNIELLRPVSEEEVKSALFQMHPDKSPGPDGLTLGFFQKCWNVVKNDIVRLVQDFFLTGSLPTSLNHTNIILIHKKKQPTAMGDLRPISLCNVIYKIILLVLEEHLGSKHSAEASVSCATTAMKQFFMLLLAALLLALVGTDLVLILVARWRWLSRPGGIICRTRRTLDQYQIAQSSKNDSLLFFRGDETVVEHWKPPNFNQIKVNVDGAIFEQWGRYGVGCTARDHEGRIVAAFNKSFEDKSCTAKKGIEAFSLGGHDVVTGNINEIVEGYNKRKVTSRDYRVWILTERMMVLMMRLGKMKINPLKYMPRKPSSSEETPPHFPHWQLLCPFPQRQLDGQVRQLVFLQTLSPLGSPPKEVPYSCLFEKPSPSWFPSSSRESYQREPPPQAISS